MKTSSEKQAAFEKFSKVVTDSLMHTYSEALDDISGHGSTGYVQICVLFGMNVL